MVHWVRARTGMAEMDAYQFVSQTALTPVANVVDTNYTMVAKVAKELPTSGSLSEAVLSPWTPVSEVRVG